MVGGRVPKFHHPDTEEASLEEEWWDFKTGDLSDQEVMRTFLIFRPTRSVAAVPGLKAIAGCVTT